MSKAEFQFRRRVQFYDTDAMGIVHHANYILMMEEARLHFLRILYKDQEGDFLEKVNYPLLSCHVDYKQPLRFNDEAILDYQVSHQGARLLFDYQFSTKSFPKGLAFGKTVHVAFDMKTRRAIKLPEDLLEFLSQQG